MSEHEYEYEAHVRGTVYASNLEEARREVHNTIGRFSCVDIESLFPVDGEPEEDD